MSIIEHNYTSSIPISHGNTSKKQIAFTYDTGTKDSETSAILDVLKYYDVKCTFFTTGVWAKNYPLLLNRIVSEEHEIGNHSLDHPDMTQISYANIIKNIKDGEKVIEEITGIKTTLFRPPYGNINNDVLKAIGKCGYKYSILWNIDTLDWTGISVKGIINLILRKPKNGDIILMHIAGNNSAEATNTAILNLKARQYDIVTISNLLK